MIIKIPEDFSNLIEALQYEVDSRKDMLTFMVNNQADINGESFTEYHKQYTECFVKYNEVKNQLQKEFVEPKMKKFKQWNLDFKTCEVTVN